MKRVEVNRSAKADIDRAAVWYESQKSGLGEKFLSHVLETIDRIAANPEGYTKVIGEARKADLRKFPYSLWFKVKDDPLVIACLHSKRSPVLAKERAYGVIELRKTEGPK